MNAIHRRVLPKLVGSGFLIAVLVGNAPADVYQLELGSVFETGCLEPSPCDCLAEVVGPVLGSFELVPIPPPLGPIFEYEIRDFTAQLGDGTLPPISIVGQGSVVIDVSAETIEMKLDLEVDGVPRSFETFGVDTLHPTFPEVLWADVFHAIDSCLFDGIVLRAGRAEPFRRGDCNGDDELSIVDAIYELLSLFASGPLPPCADACDADDDGDLDLADGLSMLETLFLSAGPLPAPFLECGADATLDPLSCRVHPCGLP